MPRSMTAFARAQDRFDWGTLTWELRSVNHRFLEPHFRLPETLRELEMPLREAIRQHLERGKLDANLCVEMSHAAGVAVNLDLARQYIDAANVVGSLMDNPAAVTPLDILRWPGVLAEPSLDPAIIKAAALALFDSALHQLVDTREREGDKLAALISQRLASIAAEIPKVRAAVPQLRANQRQKLRDRLSEFTASLDGDRLEQELVYMAQRADVEEELDRLVTHVEEVARVLASSQPIGRRLDFLMQELNREANTLAAKSAATTTTQSAIELKILIEQMREQIQNLE
ncbi:MAG: YicC/YloC family endoribonuclease [Porticoccaceae bacterium]